MKALRIGSVLVVATASLLGAAAAQGATLTANTFTDERDVVPNATCSFREAVQSANSNANFGGCAANGAYGADIVLLPGGTYTLTIPSTNESANVNGDVDLTSQVALSRASLAPVTINGGGIDRVLEIAAAAGGSIVDGVTITGGRSDNGFLAGGVLVSTQATISNSLITGNTSGASAGGVGGGLGGDLTLVNSTVSGNTSPSNGGGVHFQGGSRATLIHATVTGNVAGTGGGLQTFGAGSSLTLQNSIVAGNTDTAAPDQPDCNTTGGAVITITGNSLIGSTTGCTLTPNAGSILNQPAQLGPLADNGGPTRTHALLKGSPAIDQGSSINCRRPDQRGAPQERACDMGAYERATCGGVAVNRIGTAGNDSLVGTAGSDGILGLAGKDKLMGLKGNDGLCGGGGRDTLKGGGGRDKLLGQGKRDRCIGGGGRDVAKKCEVRKGI